MVPKLVRDRLPEHILASGRDPHTYNAEPRDREDWLTLKLQEEVDEFKPERDPMELVDIYEVLCALWTECNPEADVSLDRAAEIKREALGGYEGFTVLTGIKPGR